MKKIGKHINTPDDKFDKHQLQLGIKIEMEHTDDPLMAKEIAKDHLFEIKDYYSRLIKMEREAKESNMIEHLDIITVENILNDKKKKYHR